MVAVTLLGRDFDVAPYKLGALRRAAPYVDRVNSTIGSLSTVEGAIEVMSELAGFVLIGLEKIDPTITADVLDEQIGYDDIPALQAAFRDILGVSGLKPKGEAKANPAETDPASALSEPSLPSSSSSSQPE